MENEISLSNFRNIKQKQLDAFCKYWISKHEDEDWPLEMNEGEWEEQFQAFVELNNNPE
jgi:hypothetical protein